MRALFVTTALAASVFATAAAAHPGSKILTTGSGKERTAMTEGVRFEDVNGVHVFRGAAMLAGDEPAPAASVARAVEVEIIIEKTPWRRFRHLRTQGFYAGDAYPSRRYTQGYYSTGR